MRIALKLFTVVICLLFVTKTKAWTPYDFTRQGVYYKINDDKVTVSVSYITSYTRSPGDGTGATETTTYYNTNIQYEDEVIIPDSVQYDGQWYSVTAIRDHAFENCSKLTNVVFGKNVSTIGAQAFYKCTKLNNITLGENVTSIKGSAFAYCSSLGSIIFSEVLNSVSRSAFWSTPWYSSQPSGVVYAGPLAYTFKGTVPENTNLVFKEGTKYIASQLCYGRSYDSYSVTTGQSVDGENKYKFGTNILSISFPSTLLQIGGEAFSDCKKSRNCVIQ